MAGFLTDDASRNGRQVPDRAILAELLEIAFFFSLSREEGASVRCALLILDPANPDPRPPLRLTDRRWQCVPLRERLPLTVATLSKLAPAADPWATALAVHHYEEGWFVWALLDQQVHFNRWRYLDAESGPDNPHAYRILVEDVGHIVIYWDYDAIIRQVRDQLLAAPEPVFSYGPIAQRMSAISESFAAKLIARVGSLYAEHEFWPSIVRREVVRSIQRILLHIVKYRHGGAVLISDAAGEDLRSKYPLTYDRLAIALLKHLEATVRWRHATDEIHASSEVPAKIEREARLYGRDMRDTAAELDGCIHFIASMARVDGLVWLSQSLAVRGFGVEIRSADDPPSIVAAGDAEVTEERVETRDARHFGMRHRSMIRYCFANSDAIGFVVSEDGPVRAVMMHSGDMVLWEDVRLRDE